MNKTEILDKLDKSKFYQDLIPSLRINGTAEAMGLCPAHGDKNPSLSVNLATGLFHCFACDFRGDVFAFYQKVKNVDFATALRGIGKMAGVTDNSEVKPKVTNTEPKVVATYEYHNSDGKLLYTKTRSEPGRNDKSKEFFFKHLKFPLIFNASKFF